MELVNLFWPTNAGMWIGYAIVALSLLSIIGGTVANGGIINALNAATRVLSGNRTQSSGSSFNSTLTQDDQDTLDDIHATQRLEARANKLNCDEMKAAVGVIKDHFFHAPKPADQVAPAAGPAIPTNIPPPAPQHV